MHKKDTIRLVVITVLFTIIGITYYFDGKSNFTKTIVALAAAVWLATMWYLRNHHKEN